MSENNKPKSANRAHTDAFRKQVIQALDAGIPENEVAQIATDEASRRVLEKIDRMAGGEEAVKLRKNAQDSMQRGDIVGALSSAAQYEVLLAKSVLEKTFEASKVLGEKAANYIPPIGLASAISKELVGKKSISRTGPEGRREEGNCR